MHLNLIQETILKKIIIIKPFAFQVMSCRCSETIYLGRGNVWSTRPFKEFFV